MIPQSAIFGQPVSRFTANLAIYLYGELVGCGLGPCMVMDAIYVPRTDWIALAVWSRS